MDLASKVAPAINQTQDLFEELLIIFTRILNGFIFLLLILFIIHEPSLSQIEQSAIFLINYESSWTFYITTTLLLYTFGFVLNLVYEFVQLLFIKLTFFIANPRFNRWKMFRIKIFLSTVNNIPLLPKHGLNEDYRKFLLKEFQDYFKIEGHPNDFIRLCQHLCSNNKLIKSHHVGHYLVLFKGLSVNIAVGAIYFFYKAEYLQCGLLIIIIIFIFTRMKKRYNDYVIACLDKSYLYILGEKNKTN